MMYWIPKGLVYLVGESENRLPCKLEHLLIWAVQQEWSFLSDMQGCHDLSYARQRYQRPQKEWEESMMWYE
jgi:hypothetical protein